MKRFYGRERELALLKKMESQSKVSATFTLLIGRRRIGKTELARQIMEQSEMACYLFTTKTAESMLASMWQECLFSDLGLRISGRVDNLKDLFNEIFVFSLTNHFTLVIDEFQDLQKINESFFSELQNLWDRYKNGSKMNLIVSGSILSMMVKIFEDSKEPLFGRSTAKLVLTPFPPSTIKEILSDYNPDYSNEDLLCLYMLTGGVPRYLSLLLDGGAYTKDEMIKAATEPYSPFLSDAKDILVSEMGKDYSIYFSILSLIADGYTTQSEIDSVIGKNTGAYIEKLENIFCVIRKNKPLFSSKESRRAHWKIIDANMKFYFRFIYPNQNLIELEQFDTLRNIVNRDYDTFTGKTLETYFVELLKEKGGFSMLGSWWDSKGQNEIDIVSIDFSDKSCTLYEVKRNKSKYNPDKLAEKAEIFKKNIAGFKTELIGLSIENM